MHWVETYGEDYGPKQQADERHEQLNAEGDKQREQKQRQKDFNKSAYCRSVREIFNHVRPILHCPRAAIGSG